MVEFYCKECGNKKNYESIEEIIKHKKICIECIFRLEKEANEKRRKNIKRKIVKKDAICKVCGKTFSSYQATTCSIECRKKLCEKTSFYNNLKVVNREINITKTRVYGQGKYEKINFIGDIEKQI